MTKAGNDPTPGDRPVAPEIQAAGSACARSAPGLTFNAQNEGASKASQQNGRHAESASGNISPAIPEPTTPLGRRSIFAGTLAAAIATAAPSPAADAETGEHVASAQEYAAMRFEPDANAAKIYEKIGTQEEWMQHAAMDWFLMNIALKAMSTHGDAAACHLVEEVGADVVMEAVDDFQRVHERHAAIAAVAQSASIRHLASACRFGIREGWL